MIRCHSGGRIHNVPTSDLAKFPYFLPSSHPLTTLIIIDTHQKLHCAGASNTVTALRQVYWIPAIRQKIRSYYISVLFATNYQGNPTKLQTLPHYPKHTLIKAHHSQLLVSTSLGHYTSEIGGRKESIYLPIYMCSHAQELYTWKLYRTSQWRVFLLAFRRIASRKLLPRKTLLDNASTYLAAAENLQKLFESDTLKKTLGHQNITLHSIPKRAPLYRGFWERLIGMT